MFLFLLCVLFLFICIHECFFKTFFCSLHKPDTLTVHVTCSEADIEKASFKIVTRVSNTSSCEVEWRKNSITQGTSHKLELRASELVPPCVMELGRRNIRQKVNLLTPLKFLIIKWFRVIFTQYFLLMFPMHSGKCKIHHLSGDSLCLCKRLFIFSKSSISVSVFSYSPNPVSL